MRHRKQMFTENRNLSKSYSDPNFEPQKKIKNLWLEITFTTLKTAHFYYQIIKPLDLNIKAKCASPFFTL